MSTLKLYTIYDKVAKESGPIFEAKNDAIAVRKFKGLLDNDSVMNKDEYDLKVLGEFNHETLELVSCSPITIYNDYEDSQDEDTDNE